MNGLPDFSQMNLLPNYESTPLLKMPFSHLSDVTKKQPTSLDFSATGVSLRRSIEENENAKSALRFSFTTSGKNYTTSPTSKLNDVDANTIQQQRKELQLMINELKSRDRELNEMVHSHHNQLVCWEVDRQRISNLEKYLSKTKVELRKRNDRCRLLKEKLQLFQNGVQSKSKELEATQLHLQHVSEKANLSSTHIEELKTKNNTLQSSIKELSTRIGSLQSKEQEVNVLLRFKDNDIRDANQRIEELTEKLQVTSTSLSEYKKLDSDTKTKLEKIQNENQILKKELSHLKSPVDMHFSPERCREEISSLKHDVLLYQKELILAGEREKRKDSLLELSRSKQERMEAELNQLRQLYTGLQKDYISTKQLLDKQDDEVSVVSDLDEREFDMRNSFNKLDILQSSNENKHTEKLQLSQENKVDISLQSLLSDDIGAMTTRELKSNDILSGWDANSINSVSPTSHLHQLLEQSRQMVQKLENSSPYSSKQTSPEQTNKIKEENYGVS